MRETKVLYTANEGQNGLLRVKIPRWVDALTFVGVILAIVVILGGAVASGDPTALLFVKLAILVMSATMGIFVFLLLLNRIGLWALLMFVPVLFFAGLWAMGTSGEALVSYWLDGISRGAKQAMVYTLWGVSGLGGLSVLARLINKVGALGFLLTLVVATGISVWLIG